MSNGPRVFLRPCYGRPALGLKPCHGRPALGLKMCHARPALGLKMCHARPALGPGTQDGYGTFPLAPTALVGIGEGGCGSGCRLYPGLRRLRKGFALARPGSTPGYLISGPDGPDFLLTLSASLIELVVLTPSGGNLIGSNEVVQ